jgi:hypothetical protein
MHTIRTKFRCVMTAVNNVIKFFLYFVFCILTY